MANLGELLAELRHDWGLKQEELADILHLSKSTISSYERGFSTRSERCSMFSSRETSFVQYLMR